MIVKRLENIIKISDSNNHKCLIYSSEYEWKENILDFLMQGLKNNEQCICFASTETNQKISRMLTGNDSQLLLVSMEELFTEENRFDPFSIIKFLMDQYEEAIDKGHLSVRCLFEMDMLLKQRSALFDLEVRLNRYCIPIFPCAILCIYELKKLNYRNVWEIIVNHPFMISNKGIFKNPYYIDPKIFFGLQDGEYVWQVLKKSIEVGDEKS